LMGGAQAGAEVPFHPWSLWPAPHSKWSRALCLHAPRRGCHTMVQKEEQHMTSKDPLEGGQHWTAGTKEPHNSVGTRAKCTMTPRYSQYITPPGVTLGLLRPPPAPKVYTRTPEPHILVMLHLAVCGHLPAGLLPHGVALQKPLPAADLWAGSRAGLWPMAYNQKQGCRKSVFQPSPLVDPHCKLVKDLLNGALVGQGQPSLDPSPLGAT
jgi:hypothetical protein